MQALNSRDEQEYFPDGTVIDPWFYDCTVPSLDSLGRQYKLTDYGILPDGKIHTEEIQALIDRAAELGGGVIVVPEGEFLSGSIYFKQGVSLHILKGGVLKGSDSICDYDLKMTRIEGESCLYFTALINGEGLHGFSITGEGKIDGNGHRSWRAFWQRRAWNPDCTNKDEQRPRLIYLEKCTDVLISGLELVNSHFWTTHIYKCRRVKYLGCRILSPASPVKAPSTDAIDIDACCDVLIKGCHLEVNDDAVALKGGKGPYADTAEENGSNQRIIIEDCHYGYCHGCLTCGSESVHSRNIIMRRIEVDTGENMLWLKMRPDTPQLYEYIRVEDVKGNVKNFLNINPWTQFFDLKGREDAPLSYARNVTVKDCIFNCRNYFAVKADDSRYILSDFRLEGLDITAADVSFDPTAVRNITVENVTLTEAPYAF